MSALATMGAFDFETESSCRSTALGSMRISQHFFGRSALGAPRPPATIPTRPRQAPGQEAAGDLASAAAGPLILTAPTIRLRCNVVAQLHRVRGSRHGLNDGFVMSRPRVARPEARASFCDE